MENIYKKKLFLATTVVAFERNLAVTNTTEDTAIVEGLMDFIWVIANTDTFTDGH